MTRMELTRMALSDQTAGTISADLIRRRMAEVLEDRFDSREFRLSESGACPRKRVARALGIQGDEPDESDAAYFERGNIVEQWVVSLYRAEFPRRCRTQVEVRTPTGEVGHIDLTFPAERRIVEVKSVSVGARELPRPEHVRQVQAYLHFARDARGERKFDLGELVYVRWGAGLDPEVHPVRYNPELGQAIETELRLLHDYRDRGELPEVPACHKPERYPCSWRNRWGVVKCPYWPMCWADAEAVPPLEAPEVAEEVARYADLDAKLRAARQTADDLEAAVKVIRERLAAVLDAHEARRLAAGGYVVTRTPVEGRVSYDLAAAITAGVVTEAALAPFRKVSTGYDRWSVKPDKGARKEAS